MKKTWNGTMILKMMKFEEWFHQSDYFGPRSRRFFRDCELYLSQDEDLNSEGEQAFLTWLKAAFDHEKKA
jgi:hypothetical protein